MKTSTPYSAAIQQTRGGQASQLLFDYVVDTMTGSVTYWIDGPQGRVTRVYVDKDVMLGENRGSVMLVGTNGVPLPGGRYALNLEARTSDGSLHGASRCTVDYDPSVPQVLPCLSP